MPKKIMNSTERFRITSVTETERVGPVLAELARLGVMVTNCELITDVLKYKQNRKKLPRKSAQPAKKTSVHKHGAVLPMLTKWVAKQGRTFTAKTMLQFAESRDLAPSAVWTALRKLRDAKVVRRTSPGEYEHTKGGKAMRTLPGTRRVLNGSSTEAVAHG